MVLLSPYIDRQIVDQDTRVLNARDGGRGRRTDRRSWISALGLSCDSERTAREDRTGQSDERDRGRENEGRGNRGGTIRR